MTGQDRQVLGLTVGVPGLVDRGRRGPVRAAPGLARPRPARRAGPRAAPPGLRRGGGQRRQPRRAGRAPHGAYAGTPDLVTLLGGAGVGAGIVADGRLLRGGRGLAGQIGHLPVDAGGPLCRCGRRGCLEAFAGLPALVRRALPDTEADGTDRRLRPGDRADGRAGRRRRRGRHSARWPRPAATSARPSRCWPTCSTREVVVLGGNFAALAPVAAARGRGRAQGPRGGAGRERLPGRRVHTGPGRRRAGRRGARSGPPRGRAAARAAPEHDID